MKQYLPDWLFRFSEIQPSVGIRNLLKQNGWPIYFLLLTCCFLLFLGCAGAKAIPPFEARPAPSQEDKIIWRKPAILPDWINIVPEVIEGNLCFVGVSGQFATEQEARADAQRNAIENVVRYISTDVKDKFGKLVASYGLGAQVSEQAKATRDFEEQLSSAVARRVKASEWCIAKCERRPSARPDNSGHSGGGAEIDTYYLVWVLAKVPQAEVEKVIAEREKRQQDLANTVKLVSEQLTRAKAVMREISPQPVQGMAQYKDVIKQAEMAKSMLQVYPELSGMIAPADELISSAENGIKEIVRNPENRLTVAVLGLVRNPQNPVTVAVAKVCYQDTDMSSSFANYLAQQLEAIMTQEPALFKVISQKVFQDELSKNKSSIEDCRDGKLMAARPNDAVGQVTPTVISTINGLLFVHYWEKESGVELKLELIEVGKGIVSGATSVEWPKNLAPKDIGYKPDNIEIAQKGAEAFKSVTGIRDSDFKVKVWPDKGESALYQQGETITFTCRANKDCYVYLYHMDAAGSVQLLFPNWRHKDNQVKANQINTIPDDTMRFEFTIGKPFGSEMVKAIASLQPLPDIAIKPGEEGFREMGKIMEQSTKEKLTRSIFAVPKEAIAEDTCVITTIK